MSLSPSEFFCISLHLQFFWKSFLSEPVFEMSYCFKPPIALYAFWKFLKTQHSWAWFNSPCIAFHVCNFCDENRGEERKEEGREKGKEERTKAGRHKIKDLLSVPSSGSRWEQLRVPEPLAFSFMRKQWFMPAHSVSIHVSDVIWCWHDLRSETGFKSSLCS